MQKILVSDKLYFHRALLICVILKVEKNSEDDPDVQIKFFQQFLHQYAMPIKIILFEKILRSFVFSVPPTVHHPSSLACDPCRW